MKAYVFSTPGALSLRALPEPLLDEKTKEGAAGAILRPRYLSPCSSDVHTVFAGNGPRRENLVLGHEGLAEVVAVGSQVKHVQAGDLVAVSAIMPDVREGTGHEGAPFSGAKLGRNINGMWSERFFVPCADENLVKIPAGVTPAQALMACDMMQTGFTAAEGALVSAGKSVAVLGTGAVGLMAIAAARQLGAGTVIALGSSGRPDTARLAVSYGADLVISYQDGSLLSAGSPSQAARIEAATGFEKLRSPKANYTKSAAVDIILNLTENQGVDCVLICGGGGEALLQASDLLRYGSGIAASVSYFEGEGTVSLPIFSLGRGMSGKTFRFLLSRGGSDYLKRMLSLIVDQKIDPAPLVTHRMDGFDKIPEALRLMHEHPRGLLKVMVAV